MKKICFSLIVLLSSLHTRSSAQDFSITAPRLAFAGNQLSVSYDLVALNGSDKFFVWLEIEKMNGEPLRIKSVSGEVGGNIHPGNNKTITWYPSNDSIFLNENILVEVKAEKYNKSFNKGSAMLLSAIMPGLGQTKVSHKPWWLTGITAYGLVAGGIIEHKKFTETYAFYRVEEDIINRPVLLSKAQKQHNISTALLLSGAAIWAGNLIWISVTPNKYQSLKHLGISMTNSPVLPRPATLITMQINF